MTGIQRFYCDVTDSDGDHITIATSADLAFVEMTGVVKVFYITILQRRFEPDLVFGAEST